MTHRNLSLKIIIIVVTMGAWDFVIGILVGILLACVSFVLQSSQISAVRGKLYGSVANSTVRRHPIQHRFLEDAGKQIHVMKLAGFLFFGTIVGVEKQIRALLFESFQKQPIRFLVLDLYHVDGVDYSACETFRRINRILDVQAVQLVICGVSLDSEVGKSLRSVGLFDQDDGIHYFPSLNEGLEFCENQLLKAFYHQRDFEVETESSPAFLGELTSYVFYRNLSLICPQKSQSQSLELRRFLRRLCIVLHADNISMKLLQQLSMNRTQHRARNGRSISNRSSSSCKRSPLCQTSPKTFGGISYGISHARNTLLEMCSIMLGIALTDSIYSKVAF